MSKRDFSFALDKVRKKRGILEFDFLEVEPEVTSLFQKVFESKCRLGLDRLYFCFERKVSLRTKREMLATVHDVDLDADPIILRLNQLLPLPDCCLYRAWM